MNVGSLGIGSRYLGGEIQLIETFPYCCDVDSEYFPLGYKGACSQPSTRVRVR